MADPEADTVDFSPMPTGYVRNDAATAAVSAACAGPVTAFAGSAKRMIDDGTHYHNLTSFVADYLDHGSCITSRRRLVDCGKDGRIIDPLHQQTGICDGCSFGEAAFVAWCHRFVTEGTGDKPRETSFLWPYLGGRELSITGRGDSGACPPYSAKLYHDVGVLPVNCGGRFDMTNLPPHGSGSQEQLCVQMRDNPRLLQEWIDCAAPFKCMVYAPSDAWSVADCIATGRPVTFGCSYQIRETTPGTNGISSLYMLGGHETFGSGFFTLGGRLGFIKTESWGTFPASAWPNHRVTIQTDDGPKQLYPGQGAMWADEWMRCGPECWAIDAPGGR